MDLIEAATAIGGTYHPKETPVILLSTHSVTVNTRDGVAVWGGVTSITNDPYGLILTMPDMEVMYAHGHWNSYQAIVEPQRTQRDE